eukprot:CFRG0799T1
MGAIPRESVIEYQRLSSMIDNLRGDGIEDKHRASERQVQDKTSKITGDKSVLVKLEKVAKKEAKDVKSISRPGFKRFGARLGGKLDDKEEKEKREAAQAAGAVTKQSETIMREEKELEQLMLTFQHLSVQVGSLKQAERDRKNLVKQVFTGVVGDDHENKLEHEVTGLKPSYKGAQREAKDLEKADGLMREAIKCSAQCVQLMRQAEQMQRVDMVTNIGRRNGGMMGNMAEIRKQQTLRGAKQAMCQAASMVDRARDFCPQIQPIDPNVIESMSAFVDIVFDNVLTDAIAGKKIRASMEKVVRSHKHLTEGQNWVNARAKEMQNVYNQKRALYKSKKNELVNHRIRLIQQAAEGQTWQQLTRMPPKKQHNLQPNLGPAVYPTGPPSPRPTEIDKFDIFAPIPGVPAYDPNAPPTPGAPHCDPRSTASPYYATPPGEYTPSATYNYPPPSQFNCAPPPNGQNVGYEGQDNFYASQPPHTRQTAPWPTAPPGYPQ